MIKKLIYPFLFFILIGLPLFTSAKMIDVQKDTVCNFNYCQSSIDLGSQLTTTAINTMKAVNLKEYLPKLPQIEQVTYEWKATILTIKGKINESVYWKMDLPSSDITIDPWWNTSYTCKQRINITTTTGIASGQSINITLDTTNTTCFKLSSGNDTRIVVDTGGAYEEKYTFNTTEFGYAKTEIWFNVSSQINQSLFNDSYYVYSGNDLLTTNPYLDGRKVFKYFFDKANSWYTLQAGCIQTETTTYRNITPYYTSDDGGCGYLPNITETAGVIWFNYKWSLLNTKVGQLYMDWNNATTSNLILIKVNESGNGSINRLTGGTTKDIGIQNVPNEFLTIATSYQQVEARKQAFMFRFQNKTEVYIANETIGVAGVGLSKFRLFSFIGGTKANSGTSLLFVYTFWTPWIDAKTIVGTFEFSDSTPPQYTDIQTNFTNVTCPDEFSYSYVNISWNDNVGLSTVLIEHNASGTKTNYTMGTTFGGAIRNYTFNVSTNGSKLVFWRSYANDTSGNVNDTTEVRVDYNFTIFYVACVIPINTSSSIVNCCPELQSFCISNTTLLKNATVNGEAYNETILCAWGCDATLNACKLSPTYQWLIVGGIGIFIIWLIRFLRFR